MFRIRLFTLAVVLTVSGSLSAVAAELPGKAHFNSSQSLITPAAVSAQEFVCGTYKGNESHTKWLLAKYENQVRRMQLAPPVLTADFVQDDVWIVEDDGTLLMSGVNPFDTDFTTIRFTPNVAGGYDVSSEAPAFDLVLGANLGLGDDNSVTVALPFSFPFYGGNWSDVHVNANGAAAFGSDLNVSGFFDNSDFFNTIPKVAVYFMDLNPSAFGTVNFKSSGTEATITWAGVPEFPSTSSNTFQLVLRSDGSIDLRYNGIGTPLSSNGAPITIGVHPGGTTPPTEEVDYSVDLPYNGGAGAAIFEDYLNLPQPAVNEVALFQKFYQSFPDEFFQLVFFTDFAQTMGGFANELNIENGVTGIGLSTFDNSGTYGSAGVLESRCNMNQLSAWSTDPTARFFGSSQQSFLTIMAQEAGHRWGAFVRFMDSGSQISDLILGRSNAHWSFYLDIDHSSLEGGDWNETSPGNYSCPTLVDQFDEVDEYLMGLRAPEEVPDIFFVSSSSNNTAGQRSKAPPSIGATAVGTPVTVTIDDIIAAEGARTPTVDTEDKELRQGFMLLHQMGTTVSASNLTKVAGFRTAWEPYFEKSCDGRLAVNTSLTQTFAVAKMKGLVKDKTTNEVLDDVTITSLERQFVQYVPNGGRYFFLYMADSGSGSAENMTLLVTRPGYELEQVQASVNYGEELSVDVHLQPIVTGIDDGPPQVATALRGSYPNPFNPTTTIAYALEDAARITLAIYDVQGRLVRELVDESKPAGEYRVSWDARDGAGIRVGSGVYFVRFQAAGHEQTHKLVLMK